jgi:hypothetical protein
VKNKYKMEIFLSKKIIRFLKEFFLGKISTYLDFDFSSSDENFKDMVYGWFSIIFHRLLIDFA